MSTQKFIKVPFVEDLITIIHVFSSRVYGLRKYEKIIKKDV